MRRCVGGSFAIRGLPRHPRRCRCAGTRPRLRRAQHRPQRYLGRFEMGRRTSRSTARVLKEFAFRGWRHWRGRERGERGVCGGEDDGQGAARDGAGGVKPTEEVKFSFLITLSF